MDNDDHTQASTSWSPDPHEPSLTETSRHRAPSHIGEVTDVGEVEYRQLRIERVFLLAVSKNAARAEHDLQELAALARSAGAVVVGSSYQAHHTPDPATFIGRGKVDALAAEVTEAGADTLICDAELTGAQARNLEEHLNVKVVDRSGLILDIFALHATSTEGKMQVEMAQLEYLMPRLRGWGDALSRQSGRGGATGGVGLRGPGETKIETDRRRIHARMDRLRRNLVGLAEARTLRRERRLASVPTVALVGYTNAGKSSLLHALTGADALVDSALFATLDPLARKTRTPTGRDFVAVDTVGFVSRLPHQLVNAFRSTLEEVSSADLIIHVVDASNPDPRIEMDAVRAVLQEIEAHDIPELLVANKLDCADPVALERLKALGAVAVSAKTGAGMPDLCAAIDGALPEPGISVRLVVPFDRSDLLAAAYDQGHVHEAREVFEGTLIDAHVPKTLAFELKHPHIPTQR